MAFAAVAFAAVGVVAVGLMLLDGVVSAASESTREAHASMPQLVRKYAMTPHLILEASVWMNLGSWHWIPSWLGWSRSPVQDWKLRVQTEGLVL